VISLVLFVLQITGPGESRFGAAFLGRARFFSADASTAAQGGSKPPAATAAATTGGDGGGDGQSGKSEQADAGKSVRGGVSYGL
jgi:protein SCO1